MTHPKTLSVSVGNTIHFRFNVGNGIQTLEQITAYPLNDNQWHTLHIERNRRQATLKVRRRAGRCAETRLVHVDVGNMYLSMFRRLTAVPSLQVDQQAEITLDEPVDQGFRTLDLSSPLVIGTCTRQNNKRQCCRPPSARAQNNWL